MQDLGQDRLMRAAAEIAECNRILDKSGLNLVGEVLRGFGDFIQFEHYPPEDSYDPESHSQYYFHAHPPGEREWSDYGHFHIFLRPKGMPAGISPVPLPDLAPEGDGNDRLSHIVAISMTHAGQPERLFTTNRWVTAETWYRADDVVAMLDRVRFDTAWPSWPLNRWLSAFLTLYCDDIADLLRERDQAVARWQASHLGLNVFEDRDLEITSCRDIDLSQKLAAFQNNSKSP